MIKKAFSCQLSVVSKTNPEKTTADS